MSVIHASAAAWDSADDLGLSHRTSQAITADPISISEVTLVGGEGDDSFTGGADGDWLRGQGGNDTLRGFDGGDSLDGGAGNDLLVGGAGNDWADYRSADSAVTVTLGVTVAQDTGGAGTDSLLGVEGLLGSAFDDSLSGGTNNGVVDLFSGGAGDDTIDGGVIVDRANHTDGNQVEYWRGADTGANINLQTGTAQDGQGGTDTLINISFVLGTEFADTITGSNSDLFEQFYGLGGDDSIDGGNLVAASARISYLLSPGAVNVDIAAGTAADGHGSNDTFTNINQVRGSEFNDTLFGSDTTAVVETFEGRLGNDAIDGRGGNDAVRYQFATGGVSANLTTGLATGADGNDTLTNIESVRGSDFNDRLTGNTLANRFEGRAGTDTIFGGAGNDTLLGGTGNDTLSGGAGTDSMIGGDGSDRYFVDAATDIVSELGVQGALVLDTVSSGVSWSLNRTGNLLVERLVLSGTAVTGGGNALGNTLLGNVLANRLNGGDGRDALFGGLGNDTLTGGAGSDAMNGGNGSDTYYVNASTDRVVEAGTLASTADVVRSNVSWSLNKAGNLLVERLVLSGSAPDGTGNALDNIIVGNTSANTIDGGAGIDLLTGRTGNDVFAFTSALSAANADRITDFDVVTDRIQLENAIYTQLAAGPALNAANFRSNATGTAVDGNDYVLYDNNSGQLFYDADGSGAGARVLFATLTGLPVLTAADIFVT